MTDIQKNANSSVAWVALVIAIVALILGWTAFNRAGRDVDEVVQSEINEVQNEASLLAARAEAEARLAALQVELAAEEGYDEAAEEAAEVRVELQNAYAAAELEASQEWQDVKAGLTTFERQARDASADSTETLAGLLALLAQDLRTEDR